MSDETEERARYYRIAKEKSSNDKSTQPKEKVKITTWQLAFKVGKIVKEKVIHGPYNLCKSFKNKQEYANDKRYRIIPFTN